MRSLPAGLAVSGVAGSTRASRVKDVYAHIGGQRAKSIKEAPPFSRAAHAIVHTHHRRT